MSRKHWLMGAALHAALVTLSGCQAKAPQTGEVSAAGGLSIALDQLSETPQFFDCESGGVAMQIVALKDGDGTPRLAYNTCQVCAGSPYAYFELMNGYLVCRNCGNAFAPSAVGRVSGGCNPQPVEAYEADGTRVSVSEAALASAAPMFKHWKGAQ